jgi:uroporphyrinogen decarboxylase
MNHRERIDAALHLEEPDRVPYFDYFDIESVIKIGRLFGHDVPELKLAIDYSLDEVYRLYEIQFSFMKELDLDAMYQGFSSGEKRIPGTQDLIKDRYGVVYRMSPHGESFAVDGPVHGESDPKKLTEMEPQDSDFRLLEYAKKTEPSLYYFFGMGDTFKWSWRLLGGMEKLLMLYMDNPKLCLDLARVATDFLIKVMDMAIAKGADAIFMDGDLADNRTTYMSPDHYRKFIKPFYHEIVANAHKQGVLICKHSDGRYWNILDDLIESKFNGFHPFEPGCMDIDEGKTYLKGKACVLGNIDCGRLLPFGNEEEVDTSVKDTIQKAAPGGGYILTSSNSIHPGCKPENVIAMFRAAKKYGAYPIT